MSKLDKGRSDSRVVRGILRRLNSFSRSTQGEKTLSAASQFMTVEDMIEDLEAQMGHAHFIDIREGKSNGYFCVGRIFPDGVEFVPKVAAWTDDV